jgi:hypothetical protein
MHASIGQHIPISATDALAIRTLSEWCRSGSGRARDEPPIRAVEVVHHGRDRQNMQPFRDAPNEWMDLRNFETGIRTIARYWDELAHLA